MRDETRKDKRQKNMFSKKDIAIEYFNHDIVILQLEDSTNSSIATIFSIDETWR